MEEKEKINFLKGIHYRNPTAYHLLTIGGRTTPAVWLDHQKFQRRRAALSHCWIRNWQPVHSCLYFQDLLRTLFGVAHCNNLNQFISRQIRLHLKMTTHSTAPDKYLDLLVCPSNHKDSEPPCLRHPKGWVCPERLYHSVSWGATSHANLQSKCRWKEISHYE